jgi:hypothetical protein
MYAEYVSPVLTGHGTVRGRTLGLGSISAEGTSAHKNSNTENNNAETASASETDGSKVTTRND